MPRHGEPLTPTMLRTRYHEHKRDRTPPPPIDPALRPAQNAAADMGEASDAFSDWFGHLDAGRIAVR